MRLETILFSHEIEEEEEEEVILALTRFQFYILTLSSGD